MPRKIIALWLVFLLLFPSLAFAATSLQQTLAELSDNELLALLEAVQDEADGRGLLRDSSYKSTPAYSPTVYVSKSGKKYHSNSGCSNMKKPIAITQQEAVDGGYTPCSKCN